MKAVDKIQLFVFSISEISAISNTAVKLDSVIYLSMRPLHRILIKSVSNSIMNSVSYRRMKWIKND